MFRVISSESVPVRVAGLYLCDLSFDAANDVNKNEHIKLNSFFSYRYIIKIFYTSILDAKFKAY